MRFEIARSLNGDKIMYIARDTGGIVRLRKETLEEIHEAIKEYNDMLAKEAEARIKAKTKSKSSKTKEDNESIDDTEQTDEKAVETQTEEIVQEPIQTSETILEATVPDNEESQKKFLHSDIKEQIEEKREDQARKHFGTN